MMTERATELLVREGRPLIGVMSEEEGHEVTRYFTDEDEADAATAPASVQRALSLLGAWSDLDWDSALDELDRIRHANQPTLPITDL